MRDYAKVLPSFWIGQSGKKLRGDMEAQLLALYLMTSPHANMIGVFHCPVLYMAHETGMPLEGASEALQRLCEAGFCHYEAESETVFVYRMAAYQIDEHLKPSDNRVKGVAKDWENIASDDIRRKFYAIYSEAFNLPKHGEKEPQKEAPSKPLLSQEQEQEQEQDIGANSASPPKRHPTSAAPTSARQKSRGTKTPLPADFGASDRVKAWAASKGFGLIDEHLDAFKRKASANGYAYVDWDSAFMEAIREDWAKLRGGRAGKPSLEPDGVGSFV